MKSLSRLVVILAITAAPVIALVAEAQAQNALPDGTKPALVVSVAGSDKLLADVGYLTRAAGTPEVGGLVTVMAGQYIEGLDTKKPAGAYVTFSGAAPAVIAFVPVSNLKAVTAKIEETVGEPEDAGGGVKKLALQRNIFFKEQAGWVFVSNTAENLANVPEDPTPLLSGLHQQYDIALRVNVRNIPDQLRDTAISEIKAGFERSLSGEGDEKKRELQEKLGRNALKNLVSLIEEADQATLGWGVDSQAGKTYLDFSVTAVEGTKLARQMAAISHAKSNFAGFLLPGAAATLHFTSPVTPEDIEQTTLMLKVIREKALEEIDKDEKLPNDQARAAVKEVVGSLLDVFRATVESGKLEGGAVLLLEPQAVKLAAGGYVADGAAVEQSLKKLVQVAKSVENDPKLDAVKFNADKHGDVDLHSLTVPVPEDEKDARKVLGDQLVVVLGTGPKSVYLAFGKDCGELLKKIIDSSAAEANKEVAPLSLNIALTPILELAASLEDNPVVRLMADALKSSQGKDHITVNAQSIERGVSYRIEVEEGVLSLIGKAAKAQGAAGDPSPLRR